MGSFPLCEKFLGDDCLLKFRGVQLEVIEAKLAKAPVVHGRVDGDFGWFDTQDDPLKSGEDPCRTHTARLLLIEPIKRESEEIRLLREVINEEASTTPASYDRYRKALAQARAFLAKLDERGE